MAVVDLNEILKDFRFKMKIDIRWSDVDEVGHVNNAVYLTYIEQNRIYYFAETCAWDWKVEGVILANVNVNYIRPLFFPENAFAYARVSRIGTKSFETEHVIVVEKDGKMELVARATTVLVMFDYKENKSVEVPQRIREKLTAFEQRTF